MGMIGHVRQITPSELQRLQRQPGDVQQFLHGKALANAGRLQSALARVRQLAQQARSSGTTNPTELEKTRAEILHELQSAGVKLPGEGADNEGLSLEKSWHSLHYLLTGKTEEAPPPLGYAILGGSPIGDDLGYGPARFLSPEQVREVAVALSELSPEDLAQRFDLDAMSAANIYACTDEDELEMAQHYFSKLVQYYSDATAKGNAMLLWID
jgi:Domain of unknown function (DUF1877)